MKKSTSLRSRLFSFKHAYNGVSILFKEPNAKIHFFATVVVVVAGVLRRLSEGKWIAIIIAISMVWIAEGLNTSIEKICDHFGKGEIHPRIKEIKDVAAGAVLVAALGAIAISIFVFK